MGYSYSMDGRLACDACGCVGGVRKRTCPHRIKYAEGGSLPYCYPSALCKDCYATHKATLHADCAAGAAKANEREVARAAKLATGDYEVKTAWGEWHAKVPAGMVGVRFARLDGHEMWRLMPHDVYNPGEKHWLSDYVAYDEWMDHA